MSLWGRRGEIYRFLKQKKLKQCFSFARKEPRFHTQRTITGREVDFIRPKF